MDSWKNWKTISLLVCVFAMVREIRPIEPFFTTYLESMNFTLDQVFVNIYYEFNFKLIFFKFNIKRLLLFKFNILNFHAYILLFNYVKNHIYVNYHLIFS